MKNFRWLAILLIVATLAVAGCEKKNNDTLLLYGSGGDETTYEAGDKKTYKADGVSFRMAYVPGGLTFKTGVNDDGTATVANAYWIGDTEVTYELWQKVYDWATDEARGANRYYFVNPGRRGNSGSGDIRQPVTYVNWRDSIVWCNALTEWYNAQKGASFECMYTYSSAVIRDSRDANETACDGAVASATAKGFRLLTSNEYELAARYRDGTLWTYGDHASGDDTGACWDDGSILGGLGMSTVFGNYAVYSGNAGSSTAVVKSKTPNELGLFDMSGNVYEWCFNLYKGSERMFWGGGYCFLSCDMRVGLSWGNGPSLLADYLGFRFARTQ